MQLFGISVIAGYISNVSSGRILPDMPQVWFAHMAPIGHSLQMPFESRLAVVRFAHPGKLHPWSTPFRPNLPLWCTQLATLFQDAGA